MARLHQGAGAPTYSRPTVPIVCPQSAGSRGSGAERSGGNNPETVYILETEGHFFLNSFYLKLPFRAGKMLSGFLRGVGAQALRGGWPGGRGRSGGDCRQREPCGLATCSLSSLCLFPFACL